MLKKKIEVYSRGCKVNVDNKNIKIELNILKIGEVFIYLNYSV